MLGLLSKIDLCIIVSLSISESRDQSRMLVFDISEIDTEIGLEINLCIDHKINLGINLYINLRDLYIDLRVQSLRSIQRLIL